MFKAGRFSKFWQHFNIDSVNNVWIYDAHPSLIGHLLGVKYVYLKFFVMIGSEEIS